MSAKSVRREGRVRKETDEVPAVFLDGGELGLVHDCPHEVGDCVEIEGKVEGEGVAGLVAEVVELPKELDDEVERVLTGEERNDGVEGGEAAPACGEDEKVGGTIGNEAG